MKIGNRFKGWSLLLRLVLDDSWSTIWWDTGMLVHVAAPEQWLKQCLVYHCHASRKHQVLTCSLLCSPFVSRLAAKWRRVFLEDHLHAIVEPQTQFPCRKLSRLSKLLNDQFLAHYCTFRHTPASLYPIEIFHIQRQDWDHSQNQARMVRHRLSTGW